MATRSVPDAAQAAAPILEIRDLHKHFAGFHAVRGVDLELGDGEILSLLGPSGCGKTTTLRTVIGLEQSDGGEIRYRGRTMDDGMGHVVPIHRRNMGMVFQSYAIWPHMTVAQNVAYPLRVRRMPKAKIAEAVTRVLALVGLKDLADRMATNLSGGQQQRVALARALVFEPTLLLLDEPFSNLDARLRDEMRAEVRLLQRRLGISVLFVTHDQHEALSVSDRIAVMSHGRIQQIGAPEELYSRPATKMVRSFLGQNIVIPAVVGSIDRDTAKVRVDGDGASAHVVGTLTGDTRPRVGDRCELSIRPQHVRITREVAGSIGTIGAEILALLFVGDRYEARLKLDAGPQITIFLPPDHGDLGEGTRVTLELPKSEVRIWAAEDETL
jgi:ABC-type Fe3+/spermidine/putrescine transport system ATPase subunit